jgi:hypothetical protein
VGSGIRANGFGSATRRCRLTVPQILLPRPAKQEEIELRQSIDDLYKIWREDKDATEPPFRWYSVQHIHDPLWRGRFVSLTYAATMRHPFWFVVGCLFALAGAAPTLVAMLRFFK